MPRSAQTALALFDHIGSGTCGPKDDLLALYHELNPISRGQPQSDPDFPGYCNPASLADGARI